MNPGGFAFEMPLHSVAMCILRIESASDRQLQRAAQADSDGVRSEPAYLQQTQNLPEFALQTRISAHIINGRANPGASLT